MTGTLQQDKASLVRQYFTIYQVDAITLETFAPESNYPCSWSKFIKKESQASWLNNEGIGWDTFPEGGLVALP